ncbi:MAG TPA: family 43 glycosylhydrolase [Candidatus Hydrogenedentes bacterium]|jgi:hypothetical protein|nr:family 43 glycosylhydrolase [Candidatus Hydrogenedentota bacterium]
MSVLLLTLTTLLFPAAPNPVIPGVADVGVFQHAGVYYLMGVGTAGGMYTSRDLVHWSGPEHAFSMNNAWASGPAAEDKEIHACAMVLHNGTFHLYWSVNHGPLRQIGHAVADTPLGPYREPATDIPFDGRIDPQCFQDDNGRLYFYTVKFFNSNIIFGQPMANPGVLSPGFHLLLMPRLASWETMDTPITFINEGPFVIKCRDRYYLVYNANHTGGEYGNYALGVAEADSPLGFRNSGKYPFPVMRSNHDPKHAGVVIPEGLPEIKNAGQPNLMRGPNGIEWWLVYFADRDRRSQYLDRAHFFGTELFIEGPTCPETPGYHPSPAPPSFQDLFDGDGGIEKRWDLDGAWSVKDGELHSTIAGETTTAYAKYPGSRCYVLETTLHYHGDGSGRFGVVAWDNGRDSSLIIGLDRKQNTVFHELRQGKHTRQRSLPLPADFNWDGPHRLRVENNDGAFKVYLGAVLLDMLHAPVKGHGPGTAGLFAEGCDASFDSFTLTRGWDEWGRNIRGWRTPPGRPLHGKDKGLTLNAGQSAFKGDALRCYEFSAQIQGKASGGIYPVYLDDANYLRLTVDAYFTAVTVSGKRQGQAVEKRTFPVRPRIHRAYDASENGNNLRIVKLEDKIILFAEGLELGEIPGRWPDARVGLFAGDGPCTFNGMMVYELA